MKVFAIASVFALSSSLVSGSAIHRHRRGLPSICGEGSELLDETSVSHDGKTILVSTSTCPPTKRDATASKRSAIGIDKRQNICTSGACTVTCDTTPVPNKADCVTLISYIRSNAPGKLILGAGEIQAWTTSVCSIAVGNSDTIEYTICYETIADDASDAGHTCFDKTAAAVCAGSGASGDNYVIAIVGS